MWQLTFMASPSAISELEHGLKVDERILRHLLVKKEPFKAMPNTYKVSKIATRMLASSPEASKPPRI